ncbi:LOW QUALITY PROTEIN: hypothetical protein Cgig2_025439 [Carnegiea gigantea]|uniref:Uncharacterized protein n=1 Tax=Carnegiea gigantea TaxID=171969 RepID=A0A9Q1KQW5_9CARY|nr:LOW QUALITY PROTEIN: hypothetical protein Cgig2_025439 [Carnegiea gigantea]
MYLLSLLVDEALPLLFLMTLAVCCHLLRSGVPGLKDCQPHPHLVCIKQKGSQNQTEKLTNIGMTNTLRKILKDRKACRGKEEVVFKKLQLREPIQRFRITRLALLPIRAFHRFYCVSHILGDGPGLIILPRVDLEVTGRFSLLSHGLPIGLPNRLTLLPVENDVMNPGLLLKQYHPKSPISLGGLWMVCTRLNVRVEQVRLRSS